MGRRIEAGYNKNMLYFCMAFACYIISDLKVISHSATLQSSSHCYYLYDKVKLKNSQVNARTVHKNGA